MSNEVKMSVNKFLVAGSVLSTEHEPSITYIFQLRPRCN